MFFSGNKILPAWCYFANLHVTVYYFLENMGKMGRRKKWEEGNLIPAKPHQGK